MQTLRELVINHPLVMGRLRPEWTVSIRKGQQGFRVRVVEAKNGIMVREIGFWLLEGLCLAETLHLIAEAEQTIPGIINCGQEECFRHMAFQHWAAYCMITLRYGSPVIRYIAPRIRPATKGNERPAAPTKG